MSDIISSILSYNLDPLAYVTRPLNLSNDVLEALGQRLGIGVNESSDIKKISDKLTDTTIKRACCSQPRGSSDGTISIPVKIPIPTGFTQSGGILNPINNQFKYINKTVTMPSSVCPASFTPNSANENSYTDCDDFMDTYCTNVKEEITKLNNGVYSAALFNKYSPECACYGEKPAGIDNTYPPKVYMPSCDANSGAYLDKNSRTSQITVVDCSVTNSFKDLVAGSGIDISNFKVNQNCGASASTSPTAATTTTSNSASTTTNIVVPSTTTQNSSNKSTGSVSGTSGSQSVLLPYATTTTVSTPTTQTSTPVTSTSTTSTSTSSNMATYLFAGGTGLISSLLLISCIITIIIIAVVITKKKSTPTNVLTGGYGVFGYNAIPIILIILIIVIYCGCGKLT